MSIPRYVQHISGQGERWLLLDSPYNQQPLDDWCVLNANRAHSLFLPRSEYRLCDPLPETWRDVTADIQYSDPANAQVQRPGELTLECLQAGRIFPGFRLRKVQLLEADPPNHTTGARYPTCGHPRVHNVWAFLVEQRQP